MESYLDVTLPIESTSLPSWQRKAIADSPFNTPKKKRVSKQVKTPISGKQYHREHKKRDRFIPTREGMDFDICNWKVTSCEAEKENPDVAGVGKYRQTLAVNLLGEFNSVRKTVLAFRERTPKIPQPHVNRVWTNHLSQDPAKSKPYRQISASPSRILDAPELRDDYYLNLLSWSNDKILAVALNQTVYLWNAETGVINELNACVRPNDYVTSVSWVTQGNSHHLAIGTDHAEVQLWDATHAKQIRSMRGHAGRVGSLAWNATSLSSGSRDSTIFQHDVRTLRHHTSTYRGHHQEVCGLTWSPDGSTLASGGNDNLLCLWDRATGRNGHQNARQTLTGHHAAVKALAWCPWERNLLASGGGTADRTIKFWNSSSGLLLNSIDTNSQVCGLIWSKSEKEILSSHGFSHYQLCLWKYPSMTKVKELKGHSARVLHMAMSPDGSTIVSAAADETLRFWDVFPASDSSKGTDNPGTNKYARIAGIR